MNSAELVTKEYKAEATIQREVEELHKAVQYGHVPKVKPDNSVHVLFKNFNSLRVFATGKAQRKKIQCLRKILKEYDTNIFAG